MIEKFSLTARKPARLWANGSSRRLFIISQSAAVGLWLFTIITTRIVHVDPNAFLGALPNLPVTFWAAMLLSVLALKIAHDSEDANGALVALTVLILILYGTLPLVEPNPRIYSGYYPTGLAAQIENLGRLSPNLSLSPVNPYLYYGGFPIWAASLNTISGVDMVTMMRFYPAALIFLATMGIFAFFSALDCPLKQRVLGATMFVAFFWLVQGYFAPQMVGYVLLICLFAAFARLNRTGEGWLKIAVAILFTAICVTHPLTALAGIFFAAAMTVIKHFSPGHLQPSSRHVAHGVILLFFVAVFASWFIYIASAFFYNSLSVMLGMLNVDTIFSMLFARKVEGLVNFSKTFVFAVGLFYEALVFLAPVAYTAFMLVKFRRKTFSDNLTPLSILAGAVLLLPLVYGGEIIQRTYMVALPASLFFLTQALGRRKRAGFLLLTILLIANPVMYAGDEMVKITETADVVGSQFFAVYTPTNSSTFYNFQPIVWFYSPQRAYEKRYISDLWIKPDLSITKLLTDHPTQYVILSRMEAGFVAYSLNGNLYQETMPFTDSGNRIYDSGNFQVFEFPKEEI